MSKIEEVRGAMIAAMKAKDKVALETLRNVKKVFLEAKTAPGANDTLTDDAALKIIQKLAKQGKDAAEIYVQQGRQDLADDELAQVKVLESYLPKQLSAEEVAEKVAALIEAAGLEPIVKNKGMIMKTVMGELKGKADGKVIGAAVDALLK
jgi:uncharacterized protein YqeY